MKRIAWHRTLSLNVFGIATSLALTSMRGAWALPLGEQVVAGSVVVTKPAAGKMLLEQGTVRAIVNWQGFSIDAGESVRIQQPKTSSLLLNRVVGSDPSRIFGQLTSNGSVFLVNPSGVLFGAGSSVDVGSLVVSTLGLSDADFLAGHYRFSGGAGGSVVNRGTISVADRGTVALLGGSVSNDGSITAKLGTVALASGSRVTLDLAGDGLSKIVVTQAALDAQVANGGAIVADGGAIVLSAAWAGCAGVDRRQSERPVARAFAGRTERSHPARQRAKRARRSCPEQSTPPGPSSGLAVARSMSSAIESVPLNPHYSTSAAPRVAAGSGSAATPKAPVRACGTRQPHSSARTRRCVPMRSNAATAAASRFWGLTRRGCTARYRLAAAHSAAMAALWRRRASSSTRPERASMQQRPRAWPAIGCSTPPASGSSRVQPTRRRMRVLPRISARPRFPRSSPIRTSMQR